MVVGLSENTAFKQLQNELAAHAKSLNIAKQFAADPKRAEKFTRKLLNVNGQLQVYFDFSKNLIDEKLFQQLIEVVGLTEHSFSIVLKINLILQARQAGVEQQRDQMYAGLPINFTEGRAVLHVALRNRTNAPVLVDGKDVGFYEEDQI
jgi:glucose-6-phosphate isomerase